MPSTLQEKTVETAPRVRPSEVLRSHHRWECWRGALFGLLSGLGVTLVIIWSLHPSLLPPSDWIILGGIWGTGVLISTLLAFVLWRLSSASLLTTARELDRHLAAKNRLETTAALQDSSSPLARAQAEETAAYLSGAPSARPVRALPWLIAAVIVLILAHLSTLGVWMIPAKPAPSAPPKPLEPKALPQVSIVWESPESETKANPVEEVPTAALARSTTGLKNLTLEISVNGVAKSSVPVSAKPYDQPGKNEIKVSLYMDDLGVEPFDVVSYYLRGQRITDQTVPDTTSTIQFIQVRPFRDDVRQGAGGPGNPQYDLLIRLKLAQLRSVKENFVLAHTDLPATNPVRTKENDLVGKNEGDLSTKTEEVVQSFIQAGYPAGIIELLRQAEPLMADASKKILAVQNVQALPPQEKALSLIVEAEKFFHKFISDQGSGQNDNPPDPFKDKQQHELKKRMTTAAGELELLAKNQANLARDLSQNNGDEGSSPAPSTPDKTSDNAGAPAGSTGTQNPSVTPGNAGPNPADFSKTAPTPATQAVDPFGPDADQGTFAVRQTRIVQGIGTLLNTNDVLPPTVSQALQDAQKDATESMQALDDDANPSALEPAASAAWDLQRALDEVNKAGTQETQQAMEEAQQKLNELAQQLRDLAQNGSPDARQKLDDLVHQTANLQKQIEDAADHQQEAGSAEGALALHQLAKNLSDQNVAQDIEGMAQRGLDVAQALADAKKLEALADQAAHGTTNSGKTSGQDIARLVNALEKSRANLARLAEKASHADEGTQSGNQQGQGQGTQAGPQPSSQQSQGQGTQAGQQPGGQQGSGGSGTASSGAGSSSNQAAYREVLEDLKNETQQISATMPDTNADALMQLVIRADQDTRYRPVNGGNIVHAYEAISPPLDKLLVDLQQAFTHAQREEVVKQPDLDDAPPAYRSAVSDYFETMSRDYHPDAGGQDEKKP